MDTQTEKVTLKHPNGETKQVERQFTLDPAMHFPYRETPPALPAPGSQLDSRYFERGRFRGWTVPVNALHEYRLMRSWGMTREEHVQYSETYLRRAKCCADALDRLASFSLRLYGDHGSLISGCVREHFPNDVKEELRRLARSNGDYLDASLSHWQSAGRRAHAWRALREKGE